MFSIKNILLASTLVITFAIPALCSDIIGDNNDTPVKLMQTVARVAPMNSRVNNVSDVKLYGMPDDVLAKILFQIIETKQDFLNVSLTCKHFYRSLPRVAAANRITYLERIDAEACEKEKKTKFKPRQFLRHANLLDAKGKLNLAAATAFEEQNGTFMQLWLSKTYRYAFNATYREVEEQIKYSIGMESLEEGLQRGSWLLKEVRSLRVVPSNIGKTLCTQFCCNEKSLTVFPAVVVQLPNIAGIYLAGNRLRDIPALAASSTLQKLNLVRNNFKTFPTAVCDLTSLQELKLGLSDQTIRGQQVEETNCIEEIPSDIGRLTNLITLRIERNKVKKLPPELAQLTKLTGLWLNENCLTSFGDEICALTALTQLNLRKNRIAVVSPKIDQLKMLTELELQSNGIVELPEGIGEMKSLEKLRVESNKLRTLPASLLTLPCLRELNVSNNQITVSPLGWSSMPALETLNMYCNPIQNIGVLVGELEKFKGRGRKCEIMFCSAEPDGFGGFKNFWKYSDK